MSARYETDVKYAITIVQRLLRDKVGSRKTLPEVQEVSPEELSALRLLGAIYMNDKENDSEVARLVHKFVNDTPFLTKLYSKERYSTDLESRRPDYSGKETAQPKEVEELIRRVNILMIEKVKDLKKLSEIKELSEQELLDLIKLRDIYREAARKIEGLGGSGGPDRMQSQVTLFVGNSPFLKELFKNPLFNPVNDLETRLQHIKEKDRPRPPGGPA